ncbi:hypothetical protein ACR76W_13660 [Enterococcus casseliflavus]|uniref:hypothetical protein n=1 Tax=Enterococcus casseliflavus TaxID=37734 RepID=UPI003DA4CD17
MQTFKILFDNVTESSGWSISEILTFVAALATVFVSSYGLYQTSKLTKKQIDAEVIAKSRIEWIQEARKLTAVYITSVFEMLNFLTIHKPNNEETMQEAEVIRRNIREASFQLGLMFGTDEDNNNMLIVKFLDSMTDALTGGIGGTPDYFIELENNFLLFRDFLNYYFKIEWKRATGVYTDIKAKEKQSNNPSFEKLEKIANHYSSLREQKEEAIKESVKQYDKESSEN